MDLLTRSTETQPKINVQIAYYELTVTRCLKIIFGSEHQVIPVRVVGLASSEDAHGEERLLRRYVAPQRSTHLR